MALYQLPIEPPLDPPEPVVAFRCGNCDGEIFVGNNYYDIEGERICEECLQEWMDRYYSKTAEHEPPYIFEGE